MNDMKVRLISHTPNALDLLLGTKNTRMRGKPVEEMTESEKYEHFQYMIDTIKSPFDFVDYIFDITGVSKNMTHQLVRHRVGSYQQLAARAVDMSDQHIVEPEFDDEGLDSIFAAAVNLAQTAYKELIENGADRQDARAILPSNISTDIQAKFSLRALSEISKVRLCTRVQSEFQNVFRLMREEVIKVHPWAEPLLQVSCVATGHCAFPRYGQASCKFYKPWMDSSKEQEALRQEFWAAPMQEANPIAEGGIALDTVKAK